MGDEGAAGTRPGGVGGDRARGGTHGGALAQLVRVLLLVAALTGAVYHLAEEYAPRSKGAIPNFTAFAGGIEGYREEVRPVWRARLASTWFADRMTRGDAPGPADAADPDVQRERTARSIGAWTAAWFAATLAVVLLTFPLAEFCALGVFAAVVWGYSMPVAGYRVFPWDMPALFFSALVFGLHRRGWRAGLVPILVAGVAFKESLAIWSVVLLWGEGARRTRVVRTAAALIACAAVHLAIRAFVAAEGEDWLAVGGDRASLGDNLRHFAFLEGRRRACGTWESPWLVDAGFLAAFLLLPGAAEFRPWRAASVLMVAGLLSCGIVTEYRIYFEMAPVAVAGVMTALASRWGVPGRVSGTEGSSGA